MTAPAAGHLAIDYGSSHTVAVIRRSDGTTRPLTFDATPLLPSAVFAGADGTVLTGADAIAAARTDPSRFEAGPKRQIDAGDVLLGDRPTAVVNLIAATLQRVAEEAARIGGGEPYDVVLTHPAGWGPARRAILRRAADAAGLRNPHMLAEPVAAATHLLTGTGTGTAHGRELAVFDLGGGTFDVAVIRDTGDGFEILATDGLPDLGGADLDAVVVDLVRQAVADTDPDAWARLISPSSTAGRRQFRELWDAARSAKEILSRRAATTIAVPLLDRDVPVTREEFERAAAPVLGLAVDRTLTMLRRLHLDPARVGVLLVGGATRTPLVATLLHRATTQPPIVCGQPELVVAEGALATLSITHAAGPHTAAGPEPPPATRPAIRPTPPAQPVAPLTFRGSRVRHLVEAGFFAAMVIGGTWVTVAYGEGSADLSLGSQIAGLALLAGLFVVTIGALARAAVPDLLVITGHGIHLQRLRFGRGIQRQTVPWHEIREAFVAVIELAPHLVLRTHAGPRDGEALTARKYRADVAGYAMCDLTAVGADPDHVRAALAAHRPVAP
jgi:actin-like ATPase involved in cell morphogenesis